MGSISSQTVEIQQGVVYNGKGGVRASVALDGRAVVQDKLARLARPPRALDKLERVLLAQDLAVVQDVQLHSVPSTQIRVGRTPVSSCPWTLSKRSG